jgi:hypothetical protein
MEPANMPFIINASLTVSVNIFLFTHSGKEPAIKRRALKVNLEK